MVQIDKSGMAMKIPEKLTIGRLAKIIGVNLESIRFYERKGLIDQPKQYSGKYRIYPESYISRIKFIKRAQDLGFTLRDIKELLALRVSKTATCDDIRDKANLKIKEIREKVDLLKKMEGVLKKLANDCKKDRPVSECVILKAIDHSKISI